MKGRFIASPRAAQLKIPFHAYPAMTSRLAFFCPSLELGGAERKSAVLANAFLARGYGIDFCTCDGSGVVRRDLSPDIAVVDFRVARVRRALWPLRRYLVENRPRVLVAMQGYAGLIAVLASMLSGTRTPVIIDEQTLTFSRLKESSRGDYWKFRLLVRLLYPRAARIVAISDATRRDLVEHVGLPSSAIEVISNPAALPVFEDTADTGELPGWPVTDMPVVATVGRLVPVKDVPVLLRAFARLRAHQPAKLVIIGDGPERPALEAMSRELNIAADTHFLGARDRPWRYLRRASVFVLSSRYEGFGNVLVEALAVGCPVVSTNSPGGPAEILENGKYGALVPVGDDAAMSAAIAQVLAQAPDRMLAIARARQFGEPVIAKYMDLIDRVAPLARSRA
jgi:glycosyltransferase involved in cell wall biosynthesis